MTVAIGHKLRVGVSGTRVFEDAELPRLRREVEAVLRDIAAAAGGQVRLQILSPLAEGADRLVAEVGLALVCPLPFPAEEYAKDFTAESSKDEFRRLLACAETRMLELDGARGDDEGRSYEAVGRLIVRNCDVLIGIWDGGPGKGRGGTHDIIHYAARSGPPVIWVHATEPQAPRWIEEALDLRRHATPRAVSPALAIYIARLLTPPEPPHGGPHSLVHRRAHHLIAGWHRLRRRKVPTPLEQFLGDGDALVWGPWRLHAVVMKFLARGSSAPWSGHAVPETDEARAWFDHFKPADDWAGQRAKIYRSSYVWTFFLGAVALIFAALGLAGQVFHSVEAIATWVELIALGLILALVAGDAGTGWQRKSIEYRLLAELCRKQQVLAPLAWVVPRAGAWADTAPALEPEADSPGDDGSGWVAWLFSAWLREQPLPSGGFTGARVAAAKAAALRDLIDEQITYHTTRRAQSKRAGERLQRWGERAFFAVLILVAIKAAVVGFGPEHPGPALEWTMVGFGFLGVVLAAFSAAFVGMRAYAELEMLAAQSDMMLKAMRRAREQIETLDPANPLASQDLGNAVAAVAVLMLEDLQGWARLFRAKVVEG